MAKQKWYGMEWHTRGITFMVMWVQLHMYVDYIGIYICPDYGLSCNKCVAKWVGASAHWLH